MSTTETKLVAPEYPKYPAMGPAPKLDIPRRGIWNDLAGILGVAVGLATWLATVAIAGNVAVNPSYNLGVSVAFGATTWSVLTGGVAYKLLTIHYWLRERRLRAEHNQASREWAEEGQRRRDEHAAAVEKYNADHDAYLKARYPHSS